MTAGLLALALAASGARAPFPFTPVPARTAAPVGRVVEVARGRAFLDAGARDGIAVGQVLSLGRADGPAGTCVVEAVADRSAVCRGDGLRAEDRLVLPAAPPRPAPPAPTPPPLSPEEADRLRADIESSTLAKVKAKPLPPRPHARAVEVAASGVGWIGGSVTRHQGRVLATVSRAPVGWGLRLDVDLSAAARTAGADRSTFRPGQTWVLEVREAAVSSLDPGARGLVYAAGRFVPRRAPGAGRIDGAQATLRSGALEYGVFAGGVPDPLTTEPTLRRSTAGLFLGADQGRPGLFAREEARVAWVRSPELESRLEADAQAAITLARTLDLSGRARFGAGGAARAKGGLDEARLDLGARLGEALSFTGGLRYAGLEVPEDAPAPAVHPGPSRRADAGLRWAATGWLTVRALAAGVRDVESGLERGWAGPEVQAWLFRRRLGLSLGAFQETGWLSGRTAWFGATSAFFRTIRMQLRGSISMDERVAPLSSEITGGGTLAVDWDVAPWLAVRFSALARTSITTGRDTGGRAFVEVAARR